MAAYITLGLTSTLAGSAILITSIGTAAPLLEKWASRVGIRLVIPTMGGMISNELIAGALARAVGVFASAWVGVAIVAIQVLIWLIKDDDLQKWCRAIPFAKDGEAKNTFAATQDGLKKEQEKFQAAIVSVQ